MDSVDAIESGARALGATLAANATRQVGSLFGAPQRLMAIYATERRRLLDTLAGVIGRTSVEIAMSQAGALAARRPIQGAFALPELIADMADHAGTGSQLLSGTDVNLMLDVGWALRQWQQGAYEALEFGKQRQSREQWIKSATKGAVALERWYYPIDLLRVLLPGLEQGLRDALGPLYTGLLRSEPAVSATELVGIHDAVHRFVFRVIYDTWDETLGGSPLGLDERAAPAVFTWHDVAAEAGMHVDVVKSVLGSITTDNVRTGTRDPGDRPDAFRVDHPLLRRPLVALEGTAIAVVQPFQVGRALVGHIERVWRESESQDLYNKVRSEWLEQAVADCVGATWEVVAARGVKWSTEQANGELDVVARVGDVGLIAECKSTPSPETRRPKVSAEPASRLADFDHARTSGVPLRMKPSEAGALANAAVAARHQLRIVVLGTDYSSRTPALSYASVPDDVDPPLFLSIADLLMVTTALTPNDALVYLFARFVHRRQEISALSDEEVFLGEFVDTGLNVDSVETGLMERLTTGGVQLRYGILQPFLGWRNIFAAFGHDAPERLSIPTDPQLARLLRDLRTTATYDPFVELVLRAVWQSVSSRLGESRLLWLWTERGVQGAAVLLGLCLGPIDAADKLLAGQAESEVRRMLGVLYPGTAMIVVTVVWDPRSRRARAHFLTDATAVLHPPRGSSGATLYRGPEPGRNALCWCESGLKYKRCLPTHHPRGVALVY